MSELAADIARAAPEAMGGAHAKYLALVIATVHVDESGRLRASRRDLRAATGLSRSTVQRTMACLRDHGWLHDDAVLRPRGAAWERVDAPAAPVWSPMETAGIDRTWTLYPVIP